MSDGSFVITHLAPGKYHLFALNDLDHSFSYSQRSEGFAFLSEAVEAVAPSPQEETPLPFAADSAKKDSLNATPKSADFSDFLGRKRTRFWAETKSRITYFSILLTYRKNNSCKECTPRLHTPNPHL